MYCESVQIGRRLGWLRTRRPSGCGWGNAKPERETMKKKKEKKRMMKKKKNEDEEEEEEEEEEKNLW